MSRNKGVIDLIESGKWRHKNEGQLTGLIEFIAHGLEEFLELALGLRVVTLDHDVLKMPEPPGEVI